MSIIKGFYQHCQHSIKGQICQCLYLTSKFHAFKLSNKLEAIQKFAAKLATSLWTSGQDATNQLNWPPLAMHRKKQKLLLCRHILLGGSIIPALVLTPHPHPSPRLHHCMALYSRRAKTSAHLHSYFPSVTELWNKLPSTSISVSTQAAFKYSLSQLAL